MNRNLTDRTRQALGDGLVNKIRDTCFCIIGCGAIGSIFAEMLVRTGADKLILIDGDKVELSNLNRTFAFTTADVDNENYKTIALKNKLLSINCMISIETVEHNVNDRGNSVKSDEAREFIANPKNYVFIATDTKMSRSKIQNICRDQGVHYLSAGVHIGKKGSAYECTWEGKTDPNDETYVDGYGNGSYISIVTEATSVAFRMLLNHLSGKNTFKKIKKEINPEFEEV